MKIERFEDIEAWQPVESLKVERLARELTQKVYRLTKKPGFARDYGLKRQVEVKARAGRSIISTNLPAIRQAGMRSAMRTTLNHEP